MSEVLGVESASLQWNKTICQNGRATRHLLFLLNGYSADSLFHRHSASLRISLYTTISFATLQFQKEQSDPHQ